MTKCSCGRVGSFHANDCDVILAGSISTQAQANGYRRALELWDGKQAAIAQDKVDTEKRTNDAFVARHHACSCGTGNEHPWRKHDLGCPRYWFARGRQDAPAP